MGGGLAGLTLALQVARAAGPDKLHIRVLDKRTGLAPEIAHTIGESVVECASYYLRDVLGLGEHLATSQLPKFGLRYFLTAEENRDLTRRTEFGTFTRPLADTFCGLPFPTYNLDRGRLENHLADQCREHGVELMFGCQVIDVDLGSPHVVHIEREQEHFAIETRWFVDASGPRRILGRKLDNIEASNHRTSAAWFRIDGRIDPESWATGERPAWRGRLEPGLRWLSTNHLVGHGYWVWLIPLASGATSVGVVIDPAHHDFDELNRRDRMLDWLRLHEPQLAEHVMQNAESICDFGVRKMQAYRVRELVSGERWAITGEAAGFLDPLYSPGSDFIAICNTLITELVAEDLTEPTADRALAGRARLANLVFANTFDRYLSVYLGQYEALRTAQSSVLKFAWDSAVYFGFNVLLFRNDCLEPRFLREIRVEVARLDRLQLRMQALVRKVAEAGSTAEPVNRFVDQTQVTFVHTLYMGDEVAEPDRAEVAKRLRHNLAVLEGFLSLAEAKFDPQDSVRASGPLAETRDAALVRDVEQLTLTHEGP